MPLNITFKESLSCYDEFVMNFFAEKLVEYGGSFIEICFYELNVTEDFINKFNELECLLKRRLKDKKNIKYEVRTMKIGMTTEELSFLENKNFTVCLLLGGSESIYEHNNILFEKTGSYEQIVQAVALLKKNHINFYIGITVTSIVAANIQQIFTFLSNNRWNSHAYWPVICEMNQDISADLLSMDKYKFFLEKLFQMWIDKRKSGQPIYVREFENFAGSIKGYTPLVSSMSGRCPFQNIFLSNGNIYLRGCKEGQKKYLIDHFEEQELRIMESVDVDVKCKACRWASLCQSNEMCCMNSSKFCDVYKQFYPFALPQIFELLRSIGH